MANEAREMAKDALVVPCKATGIASEVAEVVEIGYGLAIIADQAAGEICRALDEAGDGRGNNVETIIAPSLKKRKASRRHHSMVAKEG